MPLNVNMNLKMTIHPVALILAYRLVPEDLERRRNLQTNPPQTTFIHQGPGEDISNYHREVVMGSRADAVRPV
jgi:hypothetical protein